MHASICDFLTDIVQNSFEAASSEVRLTIEQTEDFFDFIVQDNGKGMSIDHLKRALDPFFSDGTKHKKRKVGLGLPFLKQMIEAIDGEFSISSEKGKGTIVSCKIPLSHIDTPPLGDIPSTFSTLFSYPSTAEMIINRSATRAGKREEYEVSKGELLEVLQEVTRVSEMMLMKTFLQSQEAAIEELLERV